MPRDEGLDPEILVSIQLRLPQTDRRALGNHLAILFKEAVVAGGDTVSFSLQPYDPDEEEG